jgi:hypothetical protein
MRIGADLVSGEVPQRRGNGGFGGIPSQAFMCSDRPLGALVRTRLPGRCGTGGQGVPYGDVGVSAHLSRPLDGLATCQVALSGVRQGTPSAQVHPPTRVRALITGLTSTRVEMVEASKVCE